MFYRGKHAAKSTRSFKMNKVTVLVASLVLLFTFVISGTMAWLADETEPVTNVFTPVTVTNNVDETFDGSSKTNVSIKNTGGINAYIRAKYIINWVDKDGNIVTEVPEGYSYTANTTPESGWLYDSANRTYYWNAPVAPNGNTGILIPSITASWPTGEGVTQEYFLNVEVLSEAVQAEPTTAVVELWKVTLDGTTITAVPAAQG